MNKREATQSPVISERDKAHNGSVGEDRDASVKQAFYVYSAFFMHSLNLLTMSLIFCIKLSVEIFSC